VPNNEALRESLVSCEQEGGGIFWLGSDDMSGFLEAKGDWVRPGMGYYIGSLIRQVARGRLQYPSRLR